MNPFLQMALFASLAASIANGVIGSYIVVKRIVFISGSIAHAVIGGIGLFAFMQSYFDWPWCTPFLGAMIFAIFSGFLIGWIHLHHKQREDTVIAAIWSFGMSMGVIFLSMTPTNQSEIISFLFGNILWASLNDIYALLALDAIILLLVLPLHRRFLAICFDEKQAYLQKQPVQFYYFLLLTLVSITVVLLIQVIGAILVIAMLSLPAAIANIFTKKLSRMILLSSIFSALFSLIGMFISFELDWPPGATISLTATVAYLLSLTLKQTSYTIPVKLTGGSECTRLSEQEASSTESHKTP
ncbi:MAG: metal ABC transporter permease [Chlamydiae bacterium]|nr:metal ABC transporter permease [Chlamydiota bacterium]